MKRVTVIGILLVAMCMFVVPASATTWETYLEDISVTTGMTDIDTSVNITGHDNVSGVIDWYNISLPCNITDLNASGFVNITCRSASGGYFNLSINGKLIINGNDPDGANVTAGYYYNITSDLDNVTYNATWGMAENLTGAHRWLNFTYNSTNGDANVTVYIYANDVDLSSSWLTSQVTVAEAFLTYPEIEDIQAHSSFAVKDRIRVYNNMVYTLRNISLNLTYAEQKISMPEVYRNITILASGGIDYHNISYSKYGPYVFGDPEEDIDDEEHEVTIKVKSHEVLTRVVEWVLDTTAEDYEDYFVTIDYDTLEVRLNGVKIDWEQGTIEMEEMSLTDGLNTYKFKWTEAVAPPVPPVPGPWDWLYEDYGTGIALWMWFVIIAVVACAIVAVAYALKKK